MVVVIGTVALFASFDATAQETTLIPRDRVGAHVGACRPPSRRRTPLDFGRIFEANRAAMIRVTSRGVPKEPGQPAVGFLIGAEGEFVFGLERGPVRTLEVELDDQRKLPAEMIGFDRGLSLGVGRIVQEKGARPLPTLRVATTPQLEAKTWVVTMTLDRTGVLQPYAGLVETALRAAKNAKTPIPLRTARVSVPGAPGSPILSGAGEVIGVALKRGARTTDVAPIEDIMPFLKTVVLGSSTR